MVKFFEDFRLGLRLLAKYPRVSVWAVLSLSLGVGVNVAIFSLADALLLRPLPVAEPARLAAVYGTEEGSGAGGLSYLPVSYPNFLDLRERSGAFADLFVFRRQRLSFSTGEGEPELVAGHFVSTNYFEVLGLRPALGRTFSPGDDRAQGGEPVIVLGHDLWRRRFGADPGVVGRSLVLNEVGYRVLGVAPAGFRGTQLTSPAEFWLPVTLFRSVANRGAQIDQREWQMFQVMGRLAPGAGFGQARANLQGIARQLREQHPTENAGLGFEVLSLSESMIEPNQRRVFVHSAALLAAAVGLVLLIACANVGNLLLARATARRGEIAVRLAVGAGRGRLVRQLLAESVAMALVAGTLGLGIAVAMTRLLWSLRPPALAPGASAPIVDGRVLAFALGLSLLTALLCGLAPALLASRTDLNGILKTGTALAERRRRGLTLRDLLVAAQVALALVALSGAGLLVTTLRRSESVDPGFRSAGLVTLSVHLQAQGYDEARGLGFYQRAAEAAAAHPALRGVALASHGVLSEAEELDEVLLPGESTESEGLLSMIGYVSPGYLETLGIPLLAGRDFTGADRGGSPGVAIVNQTLAARLWPGRDPVGRRIRLAGQEGERTVVGVARDARYTSLGEEPQGYVYVPIAQGYQPVVILYARAAGSPGEALAGLRQAVRGLDSRIPLLDMGTVSDLVQRSLWAQRMRASLLALLGGLALLLAAVGIYAVAAYSVRQRRREIALRIALGAGRPAILRLILSRGMLVLALGMGFGIAAVAASTRWLEGVLYGVRATDPATLLGTALVLTAVALAANGVPVWNATRENPRTVLQSE